MLSRADSSGTTNYTYDATGKVTQEINSDGTTIQYTYNAAGDITSKKVNGESSNYTYDESGHVTSIKDANGDTTYFTYDKSGNRTSVKYPNGITISMSYDKANRLVSITTTSPSGAVLSSTAYTYDKDGNRIEITNEKGTYKYTYDKSGQLTSASYPDGRTLSYTYDKAGNRLSQDVTVAYGGVSSNGKKKGIDEIVNDIVSGGKVNGNKDGLRANIQAVLLGSYLNGNKDGLRDTILSAVNGYTVSIATYTYNSANELTQANYPILPTTYTYTYDRSGNMTSDGFKTYAYDSQNRLTSIKDKTKAISFTYNDKGQRTSTSVNGRTTFFHYEENRLAYETDKGGNITKKYAYDDNSRPISFTYSGDTYYYITDGHGSVIGLTDASGNQVAGYSYDEYGNLLSITGGIGLANANPLRYAGYYYDQDTSLYYLVSRYYDPTIGRFISKDSEQADPLEPATLNPYAYAKNNPINYTDPDGRRYKHHHKRKAKEFLGIKNTRPGSSTRVKAKRGAKAAGEFHSIIYGFSKKKITHLKVGSRKVRLTKYGSRYMKASSRGEKPRLSKKQSSKSTKYSRGKARDNRSLRKDLRKSRVSVRGRARATRLQVSRGGIRKPSISGGRIRVTKDDSQSVDCQGNPTINFDPDGPRRLQLGFGSYLDVKLVKTAIFMASGLVFRQYHTVLFMTWGGLALNGLGVLTGGLATRFVGRWLAGLGLGVLATKVATWASKQISSFSVKRGLKQLESTAKRFGFYKRAFIVTATFTI